MKQGNRLSFYTRLRGSLLIAALAVIGTISCAQAQDPVPATKAPENNGTAAPASGEGGTQPASGTSAAPAQSPTGTNPTALTAPSAPATSSIVTEGDTGGRWPIRLGLSVDSLYDDNIYIRQNNRVGDFMWVVSPSATYESGRLEDEPDNYLKVRYTPSFVEFLDETQNDSINHNALFSYQGHVNKLSYGIEQSYVKDTSPNRDVGARLTSQYLGTRVFGTYELTGKLLLDVEGTQSISRYQIGFDTNEWTGSGFLDYDIFPKTRVGIGATYGELDVLGVLSSVTPNNFGANQTYEQGHVRIIYQPTDKLSLTARFGGEIRQYQNSSTETTNPVVSISLNYQPFDSLTLIGTAYRRTVPSITLAGANYDDSGIDLTARQRLLQKFFLGLRTAYDHSNYFSVSTGNSTGLEYDYYTVRPSLDYEANKYFTLGVYYQYQKNESTQAGGFADNQIGMRAVVSY